MPPTKPRRGIIIGGGVPGKAPLTKAERLLKGAMGGGWGGALPEKDIYSAAEEQAQKEQAQKEQRRGGPPGPFPQPGVPGSGLPGGPGAPEAPRRPENLEGVFSDRRAEGRRTTNVNGSNAPFAVQADFIGSTVAGETGVWIP
jgi:hypothetical protein